MTNRSTSPSTTHLPFPNATTQPTDTAAYAEKPWFAIHYAPAAPVGLPPFLQADAMLTYTDDEDTWLIAIWRNDATEPGRCILRLPASDVSLTTRHATLQSAAAAAYS